MIEVENLGKVFKDKKRGKVEAVAGVSFSCQPGEVFGLLGPNGAGKTTVLRMISTALRPTTGSGKVMGFDLEKDSQQVRQNIGFLSSNTGLYPRLTARETLTYFGRLFSMEPAHIKQRIQELSDTLVMADFLDRPTDKFSTGMKQKLNIARTVLHDPPVMVFDEPTGGLDVLTGRSIVQFIRTCRERKKTIIFSTHIMSEVERLCDNVAVIHKGRLFHCGTVAQMRQEHGDNLEDAFVHMVKEVDV